MKGFIIRMCIFVLIISIIYIPIKTDMILSGKYIDDLDVNARGLYHSIDKSKKKKKVKKLLLGDSVANQIYGNEVYNDSIYSLTCNQAVTVAGHYFLLNNFIEANREELPEEVILFYSTGSLLNDLDKYTFPYLLKPFYNEEYKHLFDTYLTKRIKTIPLYFISQFPLIRTSNYTPARFCFPKIINFEGKFSPLTKNYLKIIEQICKDNNIIFRFEPTPMRKSLWYINQQSDNYDYPIDSVLVDKFFQTIKYYDDSLFFDVGHFKQQYIPKDFLNLTGENFSNTVDSLKALQ